MNAAASRVISIPTGKRIERMTGRTGLSARVRLSIANIMMSADKLAGETL